MERQEGYYWVKRLNHKYEIARYLHGIPNPWTLVGYTACFQDSDFEYIDEIKIEHPMIRDNYCHYSGLPSPSAYDE